MAASPVILWLRQSMSGSQNTVRPTANPMNPVTPAAVHPLAHFLWVFAAAQNDATNFVPTALMRGCNDSFAVLRAVEPFNFPDVCLDTSILEFLNGLDH